MKRIALLTLPALLLLAACGSQVTVLPQDQAQAFAAQVDATSENLFQGLSNADYAAFTRDMDGAMKQAITEAKFAELHQMLIGRHGKYLSHQTIQVFDIGHYRSIQYAVRFERKEGVKLRIVYDMAVSPPPISGFWIDSQ